MGGYYGRRPDFWCAAAWWLALLCGLLLLLFATRAYGQNESTPSVSSSTEDWETLNALLQQLSNRLTERQQQLADLSESLQTAESGLDELEQRYLRLSISLAQLRKELSETSTSLEQSSRSLAALNVDFDRYREETLAHDREQERKLLVWKIVGAVEAILSLALTGYILLVK